MPGPRGEWRQGSIEVEIFLREMERRGEVFLRYGSTMACQHFYLSAAADGEGCVEPGTKPMRRGVCLADIAKSWAVGRNIIYLINYM